MSQHREDGEDDSALSLDAREIAPLLGLTPERLMAELRAGQVQQSAEEATEGDDGTLRITFTYRSRTARLIVEPDGTVRPDNNETN